MEFSIFLVDKPFAILLVEYDGTVALRAVTTETSRRVNIIIRYYNITRYHRLSVCIQDNGAFANYRLSIMCCMFFFISFFKPCYDIREASVVQGLS